LAFSYHIDKPQFLTEGKLAIVLIIPSSWGSQLGGHPARIKLIFWHAHPLLCYSFALLYFLLASFLSKIQKN
jgi:hypothetical protein